MYKEVNNSPSFDLARVGQTANSTTFGFLHPFQQLAHKRTSRLLASMTWASVTLARSYPI